MRADSCRSYQPVSFGLLNMQVLLLSSIMVATSGTALSGALSGAMSVVVIGSLRRFLGSLGNCGYRYIECDNLSYAAAILNQSGPKVPVVMMVSFDDTDATTLPVLMKFRATASVAWIVGCAEAWSDSSRLNAITSGVDELFCVGNGAFAVQCCVANGIARSQNRIKKWESEQAARAAWFNLTGNEYLVTRAAFSGSTNAAIAEQLDLSKRTLDRIRNRALEKLGASSLLDVVERISEAGLRTLPETFSQLVQELSLADGVKHYSGATLPFSGLMSP